MKHLATIQTEFLKEARKWDDMSLEDQKAYLKRHPGSKRKLTAKPSRKTNKKDDKTKKTTKSDKKTKSKLRSNIERKLKSKREKSIKQSRPRTTEPLSPGKPIGYDDLVNELIATAKNGDRIVYDGKTIWSGLGNRSGLHDYANTAIHKKWQESGERLQKKIEELAKKEGATFQTQEFRNIDRDRGRWIPIQTMTSKGFEEASKPEPKKKIDRLPIKSLYKEDFQPDEQTKKQIEDRIFDTIQENRENYLQGDQIRIADATATHLGLDRDKVGDVLIDKDSNGKGFWKFSPEDAKLMKDLFDKDVPTDMISENLTPARQTKSLITAEIELDVEEMWKPAEIIRSLAEKVQKYGWDEEAAKASIPQNVIRDEQGNRVSEDTIKRLIRKYF